MKISGTCFDVAMVPNIHLQLALFFRFKQNQLTLLLMFLKYDCDTVIHHISSPSMSALNHIERTMRHIGKWYNGAMTNAFPV